MTMVMGSTPVYRTMYLEVTHGSEWENALSAQIWDNDWQAIVPGTHLMAMGATMASGQGGAKRGGYRTHLD